MYYDFWYNRSYKYNTMNGALILIGIGIFAYFIHMMLNAAGIELSFYITYLLWFVLMGIFFILLPGELPNIIQPDEIADA